MSLYRLQLKVHGRSGTKASAAEHAAYIMRDLTTPETKAYVEYVLRQSRKTGDWEDLAHAETHNLPAWAAGNAITFFLAAERYERGGEHRQGRISRSLEVALPRELPREGQIALMQDYCASQFARHPYLVGLHDSIGASGEPNPHFHVTWSERKVDGIERPAEEYFRQPPRGAGKERLFNKEGWLDATRQAWADLANTYLEQHGIAGAYVDPHSLNARGIDRPAEQRISARETTLAKTHGIITPAWQAVLDERQSRVSQRAHEQTLADAAWIARKAELGITDVSRLHRAALVAQVAWRTQEAAGNPRPRPTLEEVHDERVRIQAQREALEAQDRVLARAQRGAPVPVHEVVAALVDPDEGIQRGGLRVKLYDEERGYSR